MNSRIGFLSRLMRQTHLIFIAMCLAVIYTFLTKPTWVQVASSRARTPGAMHPESQPVQPLADVQASLQNVHNISSNKIVKIKQKVKLKSKNKSAKVKPTGKPYSKYIKNKKWFYGDYVANNTINAYNSGYRLSESIENLLNISYIRKVSDEIRNTKTGSAIPFLENYHNPCWFEAIPTHKGLYATNQLVSSAKDKQAFTNTLNDGARVYQDRVKQGPGWRLRCMPYFYIIGFAKCGTTDLYMRLQDHPQVINGLKKEFHWWAEARFGHFWRTKQNKVPLHDYVDMFDVGAESIRVNCVTNVNGSDYHPCVMGEGSVTTVYSNHFYEPNNTKIPVPPAEMLPALLRHLIPDVKIILMLRNPIDRLYSSYVYFASKAKTSNTQFGDRVRTAVPLMHSCFKNRGERSCVYDLDLKEKSKLHLAEGMYSLYLRDWYQVFPRNQIKVIKMEEYSAVKDQILQETVQFLELEPYSRELLHKVKQKGVENSVKKSYASKGSILPATEQLLKDFYKPYVEDLVTLMGDEKWRWF